MEDELIAALARAAGLDIAWREFAEDVRFAAAHALGEAGKVGYPTDSAAEPWPPMQAKPRP